MLSHSLPPLGYSYDALEPHLDAQTMELHHSKHHQTYITNYTTLLADTGLLEKYPSAHDLLAHFSEVPEEKKTGVKNNLGGHINHALFWEILTPGGEKVPSGKLEKAIIDYFCSFAAFQEKFADAAKKVFWSGWVFLVKKENGDLEIISTPNQDSPLMQGKKPILGIDVWEHAYYLKFQNRRADYIASFLCAVNWTKVEEKYAE